jgi:hypothetical protein
MGRPVAADTPAPAPIPPLVDSQVRPTAYDGTAVPDPAVTRPLPVGPTLTLPTPSPSANMHVWNKADGSPSSPGAVVGKPLPADGDPLPAPRVATGPMPAGMPMFPDNCGVPCPNVCCPGGCCYNPGNRWYLSAEGLVWWMKGNKLPPLVTTGSAADAVPGAIGQPGTQVLFGNSEVGNGADGGGRFMLGFWLTRDHCLGFEGGYWFLGSKVNNFSATSQGDPLLFRPFVDETGAQNVELVAVPSPSGPGLAGTVSVRSTTQLWGTEANFRTTLWCNPKCFIDGIAGFRAMGLDDDLTIGESLIYVRGAQVPDRGITVPAGTTFVVDDHFRTENRFYGGQVGLDMECRKGNWIFGCKTKVALGGTNQVATIDGSTIIGTPGAGATGYQGGLLAQPSNIGRYSRDVFTVVPELGFTFGYQFNEHWRAFVGYNVIYWSDVARTGNQIDPVVNRAQLPPPTGTGSRPAFSFNGTDFWAQGVNIGLEFKW